jgi:hypothetical protein
MLTTLAACGLVALLMWRTDGRFHSDRDSISFVALKGGYRSWGVVAGKPWFYHVDYPAEIAKASPKNHIVTFKTMTTDSNEVVQTFFSTVNDRRQIMSMQEFAIFQELEDRGRIRWGTNAPGQKPQ